MNGNENQTANSNENFSQSNQDQSLHETMGDDSVNKIVWASVINCLLISVHFF